MRPLGVQHGLADGRWKPLEILFWLLPVAAYFLAPGYLVLISQIMIVGLFAAGVWAWTAASGAKLGLEGFIARGKA